MVYTLLNNGALYLEQLWVGAIVPTPLTLGLYVNPHTPEPTDTIAQYVLCTLPLYAPAVLNPLLYVFNLPAAGIARATYPPLLFKFGPNAGGFVIFGVVIYPVLPPIPLALEAALLDLPYPVPASGGSLTLTFTDLKQGC